MLRRADLKQPKGFQCVEPTAVEDLQYSREILLFLSVLLIVVRELQYVQLHGGTWCTCSYSSRCLVLLLFNSAVFGGCGRRNSTLSVLEGDY